MQPNPTRPQLPRSGALAALCLLLTACGGGGGGSTPPVTPGAKALIWGTGNWGDNWSATGNAQLAPATSSTTASPSSTATDLTSLETSR